MPPDSRHIELEQTYSLKSWVVCLSAALFFMYEFTQMSMFNALNPYLMATFDLNSTQLGVLASSYFYFNVLLLIPAGILLDRYSPRFLVIGAMALCVVSTFLFAQAGHFYTAILARALTGVSSAFCLLGCLKLASQWIPPRHLASVTGVITMMAWIGGILAQTPLTLLADQFGWRDAAMMNGFLGVFFLAIIIWQVRDFPCVSRNPSKPPPSPQPEPPFWPTLWKTLRNRQSWLGGLYTSTLNLPIFLLAQTWGVLYLTQQHHLSRTTAANITTLMFIGTMIGSPLAGWISDRIGSRRKPMIAGALLSLASMGLLLWLPTDSVLLLAGCFFLIGFFTSSQIISYALISESVPAPIVGTSISIASMLIMSGGMTEALFGWLLDISWDGTLVNGAPFYSEKSFLLAMAIMPIAFIIGLICALTIRESYTHRR